MGHTRDRLLAPQPVKKDTDLELSLAIYWEANAQQQQQQQQSHSTHTPICSLSHAHTPRLTMAVPTAAIEGVAGAIGAVISLTATYPLLTVRVAVCQCSHRAATEMLNGRARGAHSSNAGALNGGIGREKPKP